MTPSAVIFDLDGVIADTENPNVVAWERTLGRMGLELPDNPSFRVAWKLPDRLFLQAVLKFHKLGPDQPDIEGWCRRKQALMAELLAEGDTLVPGARELVLALRGRVLLALATAAAQTDVDAVLAVARLGDAFESIITIDDPEVNQFPPYVFKLTLTRLGLGPGDVVALVGSARGMVTAIQAGARVVSVGPPPIRADLASGDLAVPSLRDTAAVLAALGLD